MGCVGNVIWFIAAGIPLGLSWVCAGAFWCMTIVGIPIGLQCFKLAEMSFFPFGKEIRYTGTVSSGVANIFWIVLSGWILALESALDGVLLCCTIVGIPLGLQCFKLAQLSFSPFGAEICHT